MTRKEIDVMWQRALSKSVKDGEQFTRYHFASLVLEAAAGECEEKMHEEDGPHAYAYAIRAMKPKAKK